jgi:hypothetical protein
MLMCTTLISSAETPAPGGMLSPPTRRPSGRTRCRRRSTSVFQSYCGQCVAVLLPVRKSE